MVQAYEDPGKVPTDRSRAPLDFVHRLLALSAEATPSLADLLRDLARVFGAEGAGVAGLLDGSVIHRERLGSSEGPPPALPWGAEPQLLARVRAEPSAQVVPGAAGPFLCAAVCPREGGWLFWLERAPGGDWTPAEAAALVLASQALARWLDAGRAGTPAWARHLEHAACQGRLEDAALVTRRLAHDYGNVLTGILGFTELSLSQLTGDSPLKRYLAEVHRGCQQGALLTQRLRLFARQVPPAGHLATLTGAVAEQKSRLAGWSRDIDLRLEGVADVPPVALGPDQLHEVLSPLLDNACEAITGKGRVTVTARLARLEQEECLELWGKATPGAFVRVDVSDTGAGLPAEARARLFREPFYTNKPRHRGLGLAIVYGILRSHGGGLRLDENPGGGVTASVFLPVAVPVGDTAGPVVPSARGRALEQPSPRAHERLAQ